MIHRMFWFGLPSFRFGYFGSLSSILILVFLISVIAIVLSIIALVRTKKRAPHSQALNILAERRARGEISEEEFDSLRKELRNK